MQNFGPDLSRWVLRSYEAYFGTKNAKVRIFNGSRAIFVGKLDLARFDLDLAR